ncbi:MAG: hypothetical protein AABZ47_08065 [Planctomycetota bacterium]
MTLTGISPLLMHADEVQWSDQMSAERSAIKQKDKTAFSAGDDRCPPHTWKGYLYQCGGFVSVPTDNLRKALTRAGARIELKGKQTFKSMAAAGIIFEDFGWPMDAAIDMAAIEKISGKFSNQAEAAKKLGIDLFVKRAAIGQSKHVRVRPRFNMWSAQGSVLVVEECLTEDILNRMWQIAGTLIGIGDWRPDCGAPGAYGRFAVKLERMNP